jgi:P4 family phage/plasmid primase-like protien
LKSAQHRVRAEIEDLDADPWSFVVANGRIDLRAAFRAEYPEAAEPEEIAAVRRAWLAPHDRGTRPTKASPVVYNAVADCPAWRAFLALILPDPAVRDCLQRALGALLFGRNDSQCALLFRGGGGNGKSTLVEALQYVLGERDGYAAPCKIEMFLVTQNVSAGQATPEEVDLPGARAYIASEPSARDELSAKKVKALTGGDLRPARALGLPQFVYRPSGVPILSFNRTPKIKDEDEGTRRRLVFFPFEVNLRELPPEKRRTSSEAARELRDEAPGILNWLLDGFIEWRTRLERGQGKPPGIDPPAVMAELKDRLLESADPVGEFIKDCCIREPSRWIRTQEFIRVYEAWCERTGSVQFKPSTVREVMTEKGIPKRKKGGGYESFLGLDWIAGPEMDSLLNAAGWGPEVVR